MKRINRKDDVIHALRSFSGTSAKTACTMILFGCSLLFRAAGTTTSVAACRLASTGKALMGNGILPSCHWQRLAVCVPGTWPPGSRMKSAGKNMKSGWFREKRPGTILQGEPLPPPGRPRYLQADLLLRAAAK